jgi:hypothetical protein
VALSSVYNAKLFILYGRETVTNRNGNGDNVQSVETEPLFIESLAPHLGLKSVSELNWEGLVAENAGNVGQQSFTKRRNMKSFEGCGLLAICHCGKSRRVAENTSALTALKGTCSCLF